MEDEYDVQQIQKRKEKRNADAIDEEIEQRRAQLEEENYSIISQSRKKLHEGAMKQKRTTEELQRQGEKLSGAESDAEDVYKNVKKGRETTQKIKDEGRFFKFPHVLRSIKQFFSGDRRREAKLDRELERKKKRERRTSEGLRFKEDAKDTDENMNLLLEDLRKMRKETELQNKEVKDQNLKIKKINKLSKESEHIMNKTSQELRKI